VRAPPNARVVVDHQAAGNPAIVTLPKDGAAHSVRVEADGYVPRDETFSATGDGTLVIALEPRVAPPVRVAPARAAAPAPAPPASAVTSVAPVAPVVSAPPSPTATAANGVPQRRINPTNPYAD
jgi:hypothetical protein